MYMKISSPASIIETTLKIELDVMQEVNASNKNIRIA